MNLMNFSFTSRFIRNTITLCYRCPNIVSSAVCSTKFFHTSRPVQDLMEFFDLKKHWGESHIRLGRSWRLDELRIKSNSDLHKLWYVLLKERNMLMTMEHESKKQVKLFPNPERIDKVEESMKNIETIVRERNVAYYQLETGETGERPVEDVINLFGLPEKYEKSEHHIPRFMNSRWVRPYLEHGLINTISVKKFYRLYREREHNDKRKAKNRDYNHVQQLLKRFPNLDMKVLKAEYPDVDIEKAKRTKKARGHFMPKY